MRVLVTGGAGFIGSPLVDLLVKEGMRVAVIDNLSHGAKGNVNPKAELFLEDIRRARLAEIVKRIKPNVIFHLAALVNVAKSLQNPLEDVGINVQGSLNIFNAAKEANVGQVIFASSVAVYGDNPYLPLKEHYPLQPISIYGASKASAERYLLTYKDHFVTTILRYANVYGPRQDSTAEGGVVAIFLQRLVQRKACSIFGDGTQTRDFVFVKDIAYANLLALQKRTTGIFNVSTAKEISIMALLKHCQRLTKNFQRPSLDSPRKGDIRFSVLSNREAKEHLGWRPKYPLAKGLEETLMFLKANISLDQKQNAKST